LLLLAWADAQVVPATPKKFTTRAVGHGGSASVGIEPAPEAPRKVREVTYVVLSPQRTFLSSDGKSLLGKLLAFDQTVVEREEQKPVAGEPAKQESPAPSATAAKPTVVRDGKVRLLVNAKVFELPLARLSEEDRKFIEGIRAKVEGTPTSAADDAGQR